MSEQVLWEEEESCRVSDEEEGENRTRPRKKTADDVYKDDFSSDEEEKHKDSLAKSDSVSAAGSTRCRSYGWLEATDLVFENSIRDNF